MKVPSPRLRWYERIYLWEIGRGMVVTIRHLLKNLFRQSQMPTVQWPEEPKPLPVRIKGRHRLTVREDGSPKCVACYMCSTACPAHCIHIVAEESPEPTIEKRPKVFDIDLLRCVFCGYCVEACPEDAIRMDTGEISIVSDNRDDFIFDIDFLMRGEGDQWKERKKKRKAAGESEGPTSPPVTPEETRDGYRPPEKPPVPSSW
jgi:NADH-quinone oxidoreductase subunit I